MSPATRYKHWTSWLVPALAVAMLAGVAVETRTRPTAEDAEPYHRHVAEVIERVPYRIDGWVGIDEPPPPEAMALLRPNTIVARRYENIETGERVSLVLVHCRDARDLAGHYPPICYPAHGWTQTRAEPIQRRLGEAPIAAMTYDFTMRRAAGTSGMTVENFLILPDGRIVSEMREVRRAAGEYTRRIYGAAQVQLVFTPDTPAERREQIFQTLVGELREAIEAIRAGEVHDESA